MGKLIGATRDEIMDAALACLGRYGYRRTSIETIAEAARVSRPTVYHYFTGKEEIFRTVGGRMLDAALTEAETAGASDASLANRLYGVLNAKFRLVVGHTGQEVRGEVMADAATIAADLLTSFHHRLAEIVTDLVAGATDELDLAQADLSAADTALLLLDAVTGIEQGDAPAEELHRRLHQLVELTVRGLTRQERTS
jgi:AcrR family transcriptional regulator